MMIRYFLFFLLFCNTMFAQKKISFDRMVEYEVVGEVNLKKRIFLSNSKDESRDDHFSKTRKKKTI